MVEYTPERIAELEQRAANLERTQHGLGEGLLRLCLLSSSPITNKDHPVNRKKKIELRAIKESLDEPWRSILFMLAREKGLDLG